MAYGISNQKGQTPEREVRAILEAAATAGVCFLDTAAAYGESESLIGTLSVQAAAFQIVTKVSVGVESAQAQVRTSLRKMRRPNAYAVLVHNASELLKADNRHFYSDLALCKEEGLIEKIGVSVYAPEQALELSDCFELDLIQLPLNPFDQRCLSVLETLKKKGIEIHARSLFLQGLVFIAPDSLPSHLAALNEPLNRLNVFANSERLTMIEICLAFIRAVANVDVALVGANDLFQFEAIAKAFFGLAKQFSVADFSAFSVQDRALVDPSFWPKPKTT